MPFFANCITFTKFDQMAPVTNFKWIRKLTGRFSSIQSIPIMFISYGHYDLTPIKIDKIYDRWDLDLWILIQILIVSNKIR